MTKTCEGSKAVGKQRPKEKDAAENKGCAIEDKAGWNDDAYRDGIQMASFLSRPDSALLDAKSKNAIPNRIKAPAVCGAGRRLCQIAGEGHETVTVRTRPTRVAARSALGGGTAPKKKKKKTKKTGKQASCTVHAAKAKPVKYCVLSGFSVTCIAISFPMPTRHPQRPSCHKCWLTSISLLSLPPGCQTAQA